MYKKRLGLLTKIAKKMGYEGKTPKRTAGAIAAITEVVKGEDVPVRKSDTDALKDLLGAVSDTMRDVSDTTAVAGDVASGKYFYSSDGVKTEGTASGGGGGGGVDLGALQYPPVFVDTAPVVSNTASINDSLSFGRFKVGDTIVIDSLYGNVGHIAAGITAVAFLTTEAGLQVDAYVCTVEFDGDENLVYTTVSPWTGTVTEGQDEDGVTPWSLVIPELQNEASLFLYPHT